MAEFNPNTPRVVGNEWFMTETRTAPFDEGEAWVQNLPSRAAEDIAELKAELRVDPSAVPTRELHTIWEVIPFGEEEQPTPQVVDVRPNSDVEIGTWTTLTGSTTDLFDGIDSDISWPDATVQAEGIEDETGFNNYRCTLDASDFDTGGQYENARITRVAAAAVAAVRDGDSFRSLRLELIRDGAVFNPVAPGTAGAFQIHWFGEAYQFAFGELNPHTNLPWTPADIADFDVGGNWTMRVRSQAASATNPATVFSLALRVWVAGDENRVAVGKWVRPAASLGPTSNYEMTTDEFVSWPDGASAWSKPESEDGFVYVGRQARSNYHHSGGGLSKDARWIRQWQDLGSSGNPSGNERAPSGLQGTLSTFTLHGIPTEPFDFSLVSDAAIAPIVSGGDPSVDSQPYALRSQWTELVNSSTSVAQRITAPATADYAGMRMVVVPPSSGESTLRVSVHRVSDGAQVGGIVEVTANDVRSITPIGGSEVVSGVRFIEEFFSAAVSLTNGVDYDIRASADAGNWTVLTPINRIGTEESFQGTNGIVVDDTHVTNRDMVIAITSAPIAPQDFTAEIVDECVNTFACVSEIEHVRLSWEPGQPLLGDDFTRYTIDRQVLNDVAGTPCEPFQPSMLALTGETSSSASTAPSGAFQPSTNELQVVIELNADDWTPDSDEVLVSVWPDDGTNDSWQVGIRSSGEPFLVFNTSDGGDPPGIDTTETRDVTEAPIIPLGEWRFLRYTLEPDTGTNTNIVTFEISTNGGDWSTIGTPVTGVGDVEVFPGAAPLVVGGYAGTEFAGDVRQVSVTIGGSTAANPLFSQQEAGTTQFEDAQGNTWNVNNPAEIVEDPSAPLISATDPDCTWERVANINDEFINEFIDREAPRCKDVRYRIRATGEGGANSVFAESDIVTPAPKTEGESIVIFTSNHRPELEVVYNRDLEVPYTFLDHEADVLLPIYGADYQVAFYESEDRGVQVEYDLFINFVDIPIDRFGNRIGGAAVFEPLRCITRAEDIPYVVVLDHQGNVYRAHVQLSDGINVEPGERYTVKATVIPVDDVAIPAEVG